jgi:cbb3-type cytochrome oxidase maturation protein
MSVILILILASLTLALAFLGGFIWAVRSGQYEDTFTPSLRVLTDEEKPGPSPAKNSANETTTQPSA